jgi:Protocatechuate 3,4-dioxygenase beta subunit
MSAAGTAQRESSMQAAGGEGPGDRTRLETTSSQTVGPYLHIGLTWLVTDDLVGPGTSGEPVVIEGRITDADGKPVDDALIEIWQANAHGRYDHPDDTRDLPLEPGFRASAASPPMRAAPSACARSSRAPFRPPMARCRHPMSTSPSSCAAC